MKEKAVEKLAGGGHVVLAVGGSAVGWRVVVGDEFVAGFVGLWCFRCYQHWKRREEKNWEVWVELDLSLR